MKKCLPLLILCIFQSLLSSAQFSSQGFSTKERSYSSPTDRARTITVNGYAEQQITPDVIFLSIVIKEYYTDNANKVRISIDDLEKNFQRVAIDAGVANDDISIEGISGYNNWWQKKKNDNFLASKRYQLKLNDLSKVNIILSKLDSRSIAGVYVSGYDYTNIEAYKKQLRIKALQDAKNQASYLLNAVGESAGPILEAEELTDDNNLGQQPFSMARMSMAAAAPSSDEINSPNIEFKKVKLTSTVKVRFAIR